MSNIVDTWTSPYRLWSPPPSAPPLQPWQTPPKQPDQLTPEELKALRDMIRAGKMYDEATGQPDCESDEKIELLKSILIEYLSFLNENKDCDVVLTAEELIEEIANELGIALNLL